MEIFIPSVAPRTTDLDLIEVVATRLHHPPICQDGIPTNFSVQIIRNRRKRYSFAKVTLSNQALGERFLSHLTNGILLHGKNIFFKRSNSPPNPYLVRQLETTKFVHPREEKRRRERLANLSTPIKVSVISFGKLMDTREGGEESRFAEEYRKETPNGVVRFDGEKRRLVFDLEGSESMGVMMYIQFSAINQLLQLSTTPSSILLVLNRVPVFDSGRKSLGPTGSPFDNIEWFAALDETLGLFPDTSSPPRYRKSSIDEVHARISPFVSFHILVSFSHDQHREEFIHRRTQTRLPRVIPSPIKLVRGAARYPPENLSRIYQTCTTLEIPVAFQIDKLLWNGILDAVQICEILGEIVAMVAEVGTTKAESIMAKFAHELMQPSEVESIEDDTEEGDPASWSTSANEREELNSGTFIRSRKNPPLSLSARLQRLVHSSARFFPSTPVPGATPEFKSRHLIITPTRFNLEGPVQEVSNSILRLYGHPECFLRVSTRDEGLERFRHEPEADTATFLKARYLHFMSDGVEIGGRKFQFLGYSSSSLRESSVWFVTPFAFKGELVTAEIIRERLGDFSKVIRIPARWMARIAQAFTATDPSITIRRDQVRLIPDIEAFDPETRSTSCFTDGVGTISSAFAAEVEAQLVVKLSPWNRRRRVIPTCYQVRFGGAKGMLAVDVSLKGTVICLRPSQLKFDAPNSLTLDIASSFTRPLPNFLNRPLIKLLEDLGIQDQVFIDLQRDAVEEVEKLRSSLQGSASLLDRMNLGAAANLPSTLRLFFRLLEINSFGKGGLQDSFAASSIDLAVTEALRELKFRARIPLPDCWTLVGVADEEGYLAPDEIYACVHRKGKSALYLSGPVAISRSPSVHPGDVQVVTAIGKVPAGLAPRLRNHVNCVVFSTKGTRSLPSCLGGGDLDGDLYSLITNPDLIPQKIAKPSAYAPPKLNRLERDCTIEDGAKFYLDYILNDIMGVVANRHLLLADQNIEGTFSAACLQLAALHSDAVDFPKTGTPVNFRELPKANGSLKPDFMCPEYQAKRAGIDFYESSRALGQLFRDIPLDKVRSYSWRSNTNGPSDSSKSKLDASRTLTNAISSLLRGFPNSTLPSPSEPHILEFQTFLPHFCDEFLQIARQNTLSRRPDRHLSEEETFVGTISAYGRDDRLRRDMIQKLVAMTKELFESVRYEILGWRNVEEDGGVGSEILFDEGTRVERISRAWAAWQVALAADQKTFGVKSFGWIAMGVLVRELADYFGEEED